MYLGVDIGSTTSKAVVMDQQGEIKGRAIINIGTGTDAVSYTHLDVYKRQP